MLRASLEVLSQHFGKNQMKVALNKSIMNATNFVAFYEFYLLDADNNIAHTQPL